MLATLLRGSALLILVLLIQPLCRAQGEIEDGFTKLFNGTDLSGRRADPVADRSEANRRRCRNADPPGSHDNQDIAGSSWFFSGHQRNPSREFDLIELQADFVIRRDSPFFVRKMDILMELQVINC